jgi:4-amino-4-deoxy-L-arabinose transferase-like glycosyltransferase
VNGSRDRRLLIALLLVSLVLRVIWVLLQRDPDPRLGDQFEYLQLGRNLLAGNGLCFYDVRFEQTVYAYRTPGYPFFVALCGGNVRTIRFAQGLVDTSTVLAVYLIARRFLGSRCGLLAGGIVSINPFLIYFTGLVLTETLFTAMLAWTLYLFLRNPRMPVAGFALFALSYLVRSSVVLLLGLLIPLNDRFAADRCRWKRAGVALTLMAAVIVLWGWRNAAHPRLGAWTYGTTNEGITLYDGLHDGATGASNQESFLPALHNQLVRMNEIERNAFLKKQAEQWLNAHRQRAGWLALIKIARTWSPVPLSSEYGGNRLYVAAGLIYTLPLYVLILLGLWKGALPRPAKVFLMIPAIYFTAVHALSVGSLRYRIPVEPPMAVIAAGGVAHLSSKLHGPSRRQS